MTKDDLHFRLRIPESLKAKIEEAANGSRRSMTAEIIARLEASFDNDRDMLDVYSTLEIHNRSIETLRQKVASILKHPLFHASK